SIDAELAIKLESDAAFRRRYIQRWAQAEVAAEIKALRKARKLNQTQVATLAATGQSAISRIEKADYDGWTFKTLLGIAQALKARLRITFEPIESVIAMYRSAHGADIAVIESMSEDETELLPPGKSGEDDPFFIVRRDPDEPVAMLPS